MKIFKNLDYLFNFRRSQLNIEPNTFPTEAVINNNKLLYLLRDNNVAKYISDPNGTIVATINAIVNSEI